MSFVKRVTSADKLIQMVFTAKVFPLELSFLPAVEVTVFPLIRPPQVATLKFYVIADRHPTGETEMSPFLLKKTQAA